MQAIISYKLYVIRLWAHQEIFCLFVAAIAAKELMKVHYKANVYTRKLFIRLLYLALSVKKNMWDKARMPSRSA